MVATCGLCDYRALALVNGRVTDPRGPPELIASVNAAQHIVDDYGIVHWPSLNSRHEQGLAIDMNIHWLHDLAIVKGAGRTITISSTPRNGAGNTDLRDVGSSCGVYNVATDPPHWSSDGH
jgi:hypothetical protein